MKKLLLTTISITSILFLISFANNRITPEIRDNATGEKGWYYCVVSGTFYNDSDSKGYFFSDFEYFDNGDTPTSNCNKWAEYSEKQLDGFTANCSSFKLYGPFKMELDAISHQKKKWKSFKSFAKEVSGSNKGPFR